MGARPVGSAPAAQEKAVSRQVVSSANRARPRRDRVTIAWRSPVEFLWMVFGFGATRRRIAEPAVGAFFSVLQVTRGSLVENYLNCWYYPWQY
jgi:hypothetical protein